MPSANKIVQSKLKRELKEYWRKFPVMLDFRNDYQTFKTDKFRPKSSFNSRNKDIIIETYLSCLEEKLLDIEIPSKRYNNLTKEDRDALHSLKDDTSSVIRQKGESRNGCLPKHVYVNETRVRVRIRG